jgi:hypothetical protein
MRTENITDEEMMESMDEKKHNLNTIDDKPKHLFKTMQLVPI